MRILKVADRVTTTFARQRVIEQLHNRFITASSEKESDLYSTVLHLLKVSDAEAKPYERNTMLKDMARRLSLAFERSGALVDVYRFREKTKNGILYGYTMLLDQLSESLNEKGRAVLHLLKSEEGQIWLSVGLKYIQPVQSHLKPVNSHNLLVVTEKQLHKLGFQVQLKNQRRTGKTREFIERDTAIKTDSKEPVTPLRFIDLKPGATQEMATTLEQQLKVLYARVSIIKRRGRYTVAASKPKRKAK